VHGDNTALSLGFNRIGLRLREEFEEPRSAARRAIQPGTVALIGNYVHDMFQRLPGARLSHRQRDRNICLYVEADRTGVSVGGPALDNQKSRPG